VNVFYNEQTMGNKNAKRQNLNNTQKRELMW